MKQISSLVRGAFLRVRVAGILALLSAVLLPGAASAQEFIANQIEGLISSDSMKVEIQGLSGALTGNIRIESVTVADPQGVYLTARDLAMDWSPLAIVRSRVDVEALTAGSIVLERLPAAAPADPYAEPSSGLPNITADIKRITVSEFVLGEAIAGARARLSMNARLALENDPTRLDTALDIQRLDQPGKIDASIAFVPGENRLDIDVDASEPAGGLVAALLALPGAPPVALAINGSGPLSDFMANGQLTVDTQPAATLTARVGDAAEGRRIAASLNVAAERFVPDAYRAYVDGGATLDVQAVLRPDGVLAIEQGALASGRISAAVTGTLDRAGPQTALDIAISGRDGGVIPLRFGSGTGQTVVDIAALNGTVAGALSAANVALTASLPTAGYGPYVASDLNARVSAEGFDIGGLSGPLAIELAAASVASPEGVPERFLKGPVRIVANGALGRGGITLSQSQVKTDVATASVTGTAALDFSTFDLTLSSDFETLALSAAVIPLSGDRLQVGGSVARETDGALGIRGLAIRSERLSVDGTANLSGETITADVTGTVDAPQGENAAISGQAEFALTASGPAAQPDVDITLSSNGLRVNGRELADLRVAARGAFVSATPSGTVEISGTLDGAPLSGNATVETLPSGERRIAGLSIRQAANSVTGDLTLTQALAPVGTLDVAFADVGPLAALALQQMEGDLNGTIALSVNGADFPVADVDLVAKRLAVAGNVLSDADIDLSVEDYLGQPFPTGGIRAGTIEAGGATVEALAIDLARQGDFTRLDATARANGIPVSLGGQAQIAPTETVIALDALTAAIPDAAVKLRERASLRIADGTTTVGPLTLDIGNGSLGLQGQAGTTLELTATLTEVPVAAANPFASGLDATGTVSGNAAVLGAADDPEARFELTASGVETSQTRAAEIAPVEAILSGQFARGTLELQTARVDLGEGAVTARGRIGDALDVTVDLDAVPAALANGFVNGIGASGTIAGSLRATGTLAEPSVDFDISGTGITAREVAEGGIAPITLDVAGGYANRLLTLQTARAEVGSGSLSASGTVGQSVDLDLVLTDLPVGLANAFVPGLKASGTLSGTASAGGDLVDPSGVFDITGTRITAEQIAAGGIPPIELRLAGSLAGGTAELQTAVANIGAASLTATGTVGRTLDLDVALNAVPVGLANGFVPGLDATGTISGTAKATGTIGDPDASFALVGREITAAPIAASGIAPLSLDLSGSIADRTARIETARVAVGEGSLTATGTIGEALDLQVAMSRIPVGLVNGFVPDLGAAGTLSGNARATGSLADPRASFQVSGEGITARQIAASGVDPIVLSIDGSFADGTATLRTARADIGDGTLTSSGTVGQALDLDVVLDGLPVGLVNGFVPNLDASGTISGSAEATGSLADPRATFRIDGSNITVAEVKASGVAPIELDVAGRYAAGTATLDTARATIGDGSIEASGTIGQTLDLDVRLNALPVGLVNGFVPGLDATGTISGTASATGSIADPSATFTIDGSGITARQVRASGIAPIELDLSGRYGAGTATIETARATIGDGSVEATGTVGQALDVDVTITRLPVGLANGFVPDLDARGSLSGTASATGSLAAPDAVFDIAASEVSTGQTRAAGAPSVNALARGAYRDARLALETARIDVGGGTVTVTGSAGQDLDLTVAIADIPASLAGAAAAGIDPAGSIDGSIRATGPATNPSVVYDLTVAGLSIAQTRDAGVGALDVAANGQFANRVLTLTSRLSGDGLDFAASGSVNLAVAPQFDLTLNGTAPLAIANRILADGGRSVDGTVRVDARVTGTAAAPNVSGTISTAGASFTDTGANLAINGVTTTIALSGRTATIQSFSANLSAGGTIAIGGTVGLAAGFPADIRIEIANGRYNDGELIAARLDADLTVTGSLIATPLLAGTINAESIDILVPERLPTSLARIDVVHRNASAAVLRQQREISPKKAAGAGGGGIALDIQFNAPRQVFVRGRGLDIELGGAVRIAGSASAPTITGGFDLQRGRFTILSNRLDFERGRLSFTGELLPTLDLLATSTSGDVTVQIAVTGPATDPSFTFSSTPALPQDEVLARLIFSQGTADLSPLQIAQLAEAAAQLAGVGGSTGLLENLRAQLGVDDLDIKTNADGQTAVGVGKYINDNTYLGVDSTGRVSIDLELGAGLKARGAVSATGGGEVGIFYENEY